MSYVVVKLISGEEILGVMEGEDSSCVQITFPMTINSEMYQDAEGVIRKTSKMVPFCPASADRIFNLTKTMILFVNPLHKALIDSYRVLVDAYAIKEAALELKGTEVVETEPEPEEDLPYTFDVPGNSSIH